MKNRCDLLNYLIKKNEYKSYLEIGVDDPRRTFDRVFALRKIGVDPSGDFPVTFQGTSNQFFEVNKGDIKFDIIFIDGLHEKDQVYKDIVNSFLVLKADGTIVMHDCLPRNEREQTVPRQQDAWTGDVWKAFVRFRENNPWVKMRVVNTDFGMGVLTCSEEEHPFKAGKELTYLNFVENRKEWLNLISVEEFLEENKGGKV